MQLPHEIADSMANRNARIGLMHVNSAVVLRVLSAMPLVVVTVADVVFLGRLGLALNGAAIVVTLAVLGIAALIMIRFLACELFARCS
jgi:hypothetical protein